MTKKTLNKPDASGAPKNDRDITVVGNGGMFQVLSKTSSQKEGWSKSTKAMQVPGGCLVQVTSLHRNSDRSSAVAVALAFVPSVKIVSDANNGHRLVI